MIKLIPFLKNYKKNVFLGQFFKLLEAIFELMIPTIMALVIDNGVKNRDVNYILKMGALMLLIASLGVMFAFTCQYFASIASQGFGTVVRNAIFKHIGTFSHAEIDSFGTASLINRTTNDVNQLQVAVAMWIRLVVRAPFLCIGGIVMAMLLDLKLSIVILIILPVFVLVLFLVMRKSIPLYKKVQGKLDRLAVILRENLSGVRVVRAFDKVDYEKDRFKASNRDLSDTAVRVGSIAALMNPATSIIMNFAIVAIIWFGGFRVNVGGMTQGQVIAYINYVIQIFSALVVVANLVVTFTKAAASAARVNEIFDTKGSIVDSEIYFSSEDIDERDLCSNAIEFKNVSFTYKGSKEYALKDISFKLSKGQSFGIIGATGSGKSTLINLIPRFYDADEGYIKVNGIKVQIYNQVKLREKIGVVPQKAVAFTGSIKDNLKWGLEDASDEEIKESAKIAQASEFIEKLESGYDTLISQGGANLSGGQKQRLTIARALVKKPEILILDDSSSALDYATDAALRRELKDNTDSMTLVMVSQRVNAVKDADLILVLDDGEQVGLGTHKELIETCEIYKEICLSQVEK
ncbi:multidrug ABC transporter ATP-binding protein [Clostridium folliculivorans]|uniref:Multidrug ABC transporter ATP-binding protein n=1 Tax=Clostridium folliculivorans TaxID=2886038 RepID=A0A9W5Y317_9CLOT|nr:ABC transporter ATP-binding protein [Clostridium folliculivorans]GKU25542.1 multidrug ABC transporter ATP-binding protein [Clostridium folliculivorans]